jgi:hypothetical protein
MNRTVLIVLGAAVLVLILWFALSSPDPDPVAGTEQPLAPAADAPPETGATDAEPPAAAQPQTDPVTADQAETDTPAAVEEEEDPVTID